MAKRKPPKPKPAKPSPRRPVPAPINVPGNPTGTGAPPTVPGGGQPPTRGPGGNQPGIGQAVKDARDAATKATEAATKAAEAATKASDAVTRVQKTADDALKVANEAKQAVAAIPPPPPPPKSSRGLWVAFGVLVGLTTLIVVVVAVVLMNHKNGLDSAVSDANEGWGQIIAANTAITGQLGSLTGNVNALTTAVNNDREERNKTEEKRGRWERVTDEAIAKMRHEAEESKKAATKPPTPVSTLASAPPKAAAPRTATSKRKPSVRVASSSNSFAVLVKNLASADRAVAMDAAGRFVGLGEEGIPALVKVYYAGNSNMKARVRYCIKQMPDAWRSWLNKIRAQPRSSDSDVVVSAEEINLEIYGVIDEQSVAERAEDKAAKALELEQKNGRRVNDLVNGLTAQYARNCLRIQDNEKAIQSLQRDCKGNRDVVLKGVEEISRLRAENDNLKKSNASLQQKADGLEKRIAPQTVYVAVPAARVNISYGADRNAPVVTYPRGACVPPTVSYGAD